MPPVKVPKKLLKSMESGSKQPVIKSIEKKATKKKYDSFARFLFKILKSCNSDVTGISQKSIVIMNSFVLDVLEKIACEAGRLNAHGKKRVLGENEIRTAAKLLIPGELGKHALLEGEKAIRSYKNNSNSQSY